MKGDISSQLRQWRLAVSSASLSAMEKAWASLAQDLHGEALLASVGLEAAHGVEFCLGKGVDPSGESDRPSPALMACRKKFWSILKQLGDAGATLAPAIDPQSILVSMAASGHDEPDLVQRCVLAGASLDCHPQRSAGPVFYFVLLGSVKSLQRLLEMGEISPETKVGGPSAKGGQTILSMAVEFNSLPVTEWSLSNGAKMTPDDMAMASPEVIDWINRTTHAAALGAAVPEVGFSEKLRL